MNKIMSKLRQPMPAPRQRTVGVFLLFFAGRMALAHARDMANTRRDNRIAKLEEGLAELEGDVAWLKTIPELSVRSRRG